MVTTTTTKGSGGTSRPLPGVYVPPERQKALDELQSLADDANGVFLADELSGMIAHEQGGLRLYRSAAQRTRVAALRQGYERSAEDTEQHLEALQGLVRDLGGDPQYVSPSARATEAMATAVLESTFLLDGSVDAVTRELVLLDAAAVTEGKDQGNWTWLESLVDELPQGSTRDRIQSVAQQVTSEIQERYPWAIPLRSTVSTLLATSPDLADAAQRPDDAVDRLSQQLS